MGILRADILTHSQLESAGGSVVFDGSGDYLTIPNHSAFHFTGDYTIDFYIKFSTFSGTQRIFGQRNSNASDLSVLGEFASNNFYYYYSQNGTNSENIIIGSSGSSDETKNLELNTWYHVAIVSNGGVHHSYLNGVLTAVNVNNPPPLNDGDSTWSIGRQGAYTPNEFNGSIYGFRITQGALYKDNFTVSKFKPKVLSGTVLLCCVSSTSVTEAEVSVAGDITSNGDPQIGDTPLLKEDITDTGVVFDGFTTFATSTYMIPPSGKTTERNRGRGIFADGDQSKTIEFINIQSLGNSQDFGDSTTDFKQRSTVGSSTRAVTAGGFDSPAFTNIIDFITIATTSNATDFGDLLTAKRNPGGAGNNTRGIYLGGGNPGNTNTIEFITIATAGNAQDFGDATAAKSGMGSLASPTRACFGGGQDNTIEFVTISTTGNAQDFGDLISGQTEKPAGTSSSTRGLFICGESQPSGTRINTIQFITIASTGNATDFGDHTDLRRALGACSNSIRAVYGGGNTPSGTVNTLSFVTIATTGNGQDFGDLLSARNIDGTTSSDSHGGIE